MTAPNMWDKITAYVAENRFNTAKEAEVLQKEVIETLAEDTIDDLVEDQNLDCIYDDEPLGFEEDPMGSATKMRAPSSKLCLCLYFSCVKLKHYIKPFDVYVYSHCDIIKHILSKPILHSRVGKWALALTEYSLTYQSLKSVKGQIMADFIADHSIDEPLPEASRVSPGSCISMDPTIKMALDWNCGCFTQE